MESMSKALVDELSIEVVACAHDDCWKKAVCKGRVWFILFDDMEADVVKIYFSGCFDANTVALGVTEAPRL